ncbi:MAG: beta-lactamase family protein [bacterium]|nr:beta-lactamase family protein [bacterium]
MRSLTTILVLAILLVAGTSGAAPTPRLQALADTIDAQCRELGIPGLAVVVVKNDKVILEHCYGSTDLAGERPVTPSTIFPVGSTSKPFTSTLAAALVSDGDLSWDTPVTDVLPWFQLRIRSDDPEARVLIRDLLSHRTGVFTMELIQRAANWAQAPDYEPSFDRPGIMRAALEFEPIADFRAEHHYSNVSMVAVAEACAEVAGHSWDDLMRQRLFGPLGMTGSGTISARIDGRDDVATGHLLGKDGYAPAMFLDMDCIAPAGGVWSTLEDMTSFLRFLLHEGEWNGEQLIAAEHVRETWTEHVGEATVGGNFPGARYGLGWFLTETHGYQVVEHGGNALGYSANLVLIPSEDVGYVMLSNALPNTLQMSLSEEVWRAVDLVE